MQWCLSKRRIGYENHFRNRPISGGLDFSGYGAERLPELHSLSPAGGHCGTVHGCPLSLALLVGDLRVSTHRRCTSAGQPLRTVGGGSAGTGDCQHPYFPRLDGPERASAGPLRGPAVGRDLHRRATGLFRIVPVALGQAKRGQSLKKETSTGLTRRFEEVFQLCRAIERFSSLE